MQPEWPVGSLSSLEAMELLTMNPTPDRFPRPIKGVASAVFHEATLVCKTDLTESSYVDVKSGEFTRYKC